MGIPSDAWFREQEWRFRLLRQQAHDVYAMVEMARIFRPSASRMPVISLVTRSFAPADGDTEGGR